MRAPAIREMLKSALAAAASLRDRTSKHTMSASETCILHLHMIDQHLARRYDDDAALLPKPNKNL